MQLVQIKRQIQVSVLVTCYTCSTSSITWKHTLKMGGSTRLTLPPIGRALVACVQIEIRLLSPKENNWKWKIRCEYCFVTMLSKTRLAQHKMERIPESSLLWPYIYSDYQEQWILMPESDDEVLKNPRHWRLDEGVTQPVTLFQEYFGPPHLTSGTPCSICVRIFSAFSHPLNSWVLEWLELSLGPLSPVSWLVLRSSYLLPPV